MIISKTPLRVSFFGGGSDFPDFYNEAPGACLSAAIKLYVYVCVNTRWDGKTAVNYGDTHEIVDDASDLQHDLIRSAITTAFYQGYDARETEITTIADVTGKGSGLGSSSALTVGALHAFMGGVEVHPLAEISNHIELNVLKRPQGIQDAYPAQYGGLRLYNFYEYSVQIGKPIDPGPLFNNLLLFNTGTTRRADTILSEQRAKTAVNHYQISQMSQMARDGAELLKQQKYDDFGAMLDDAWQIKRRLTSKTTNGHIDAMYTMAMDAGALGGKVCGAGGGGFMLLYVPEDKQAAVRSVLSEYREYPVHLSEEGSTWRKV